MNIKLTIAAAALASLMLSGAAFAASEDYPASTGTGVNAPVTIGNYVSTQSSEAYPSFAPALGTTTLSAPVLAQNNGSESAVQSPNSVPAGFEIGTSAYADRQVANRWFAQQAQRHYAAMRVSQPRG